MSIRRLARLLSHLPVHDCTCLVAVLLCACTGAETERPRLTRQQELRQQLRPRPVDRAPLSRLEAAAATPGAAASAFADLAGALLRLGQYGRCLEVLEQGLQRQPEDPRLHYLAGEAAKRVGQYDQAVGHLQALVSRVPDFADGHFSLCAAFAHRAPAAAAGSPARVIPSDLDSAVAHCGRAVTLEPDNPVFHYNLGRALRLRNDFTGAAAEYRRAVELGQEAAEVHLQLGKVLEKTGDIEGARAALEKSVALDSTDAETQYVLARVLDLQGDTQGSADRYRRSLDLRPDVADAHYNLARVLYKLGEEEAGDRHMEQFQRLDSGERVGVRSLELRVQRHPADAGLRRGLASAYEAAGRYDRAAEELRVARALEPEDAATHYDLGLLLERDGRLDEAATALRRALEADPHHLGARFQLAVVLLKADRPVDAARELERVVDEEPRYPKAAALLEAVRARLGERPG